MKSYQTEKPQSPSNLVNQNSKGITSSAQVYGTRARSYSSTWGAPITAANLYLENANRKAQVNILNSPSNHCSGFPFMFVQATTIKNANRSSQLQLQAVKSLGRRLAGPCDWNKRESKEARQLFQVVIMEGQSLLECRAQTDTYTFHLAYKWHDRSFRSTESMC